MSVLNDFDRLFEADGDEQTEDDGGDVDKEVAPGAGGVVGGVDVEHGSILFRSLWNVVSLRRLALVGGCHCHSTRSRDFGKRKLFWGFWCLWHAVSCGFVRLDYQRFAGAPKELGGKLPGKRVIGNLVSRSSTWPATVF